MFDPGGVLFPLHASLQSWKTWSVICKCAVNIQETMVRLWLLFPLIRHSWLNVRQKSNLRPKPNGGIYSDRNRGSKYNRSSCVQASPDLSVPSIWQCYCCITHLIAVNLVAIFEAKCFAEGNVDGIAHNGHCKRITYYLREQWDVWGTRGFQTGNGKCEWFLTSELIVDGSNLFHNIHFTIFHSKYSRLRGSLGYLPTGNLSNDTDAVYICKITKVGDDCCCNDLLRADTRTQFRGWAAGSC